VQSPPAQRACEEEAPSLPRTAGGGVGPGRWTCALSLAALMLAGGMVRLVVGDQGQVWLNEACSLLIARHSLPEICRATASDVHPPLFYFSLAAVDRAAPDPLRAGRGLSFVLSLALVPVTYGLARLWFGRGASLLAASLISASPAICSHATELRMYPLIGLLTGCFLWSAFRLLGGKPGGWVWIVLIACGTLGLYATYFFVPLLLGAAVAAGAVHWREPRRLLVWLGALAAMALLWVPWWLAFLQALRFVRATFWSEPVGLLAALRSCKAFVDALMGLEHGWPMVPYWADRLLRLAILALLATGGVAALRSRGLRPVAVATVAFFGVLVVVSVTMRSLLVERSLLLVAPMLVVILVAGVRALPRVWHVPIGAVLAALPVPGLVRLYVTGLVPRPLPTTAGIIEALHQPGDIVAHTSMWTYYPLRYYTEDRPEHRLLLPSNFSPPTARALGESRAGADEIAAWPGRVWLLVLDDPLHEGRDLEVAAELCGQRPVLWRERFGNTDLVLLGEDEPTARPPAPAPEEHATEDES
jgi:hypothetical protein